MTVSRCQIDRVEKLCGGNETMKEKNVFNGSDMVVTNAIRTALYDVDCASLHERLILNSIQKSLSGAWSVFHFRFCFVYRSVRD